MMCLPPHLLKSWDLTSPPSGHQSRTLTTVLRSRIDRSRENQTDLFKIPSLPNFLGFSVPTGHTSGV